MTRVPTQLPNSAKPCHGCYGYGYEDCRGHPGAPPIRYDAYSTPLRFRPKHAQEGQQVERRVLRVEQNLPRGFLADNSANSRQQSTRTNTHSRLAFSPDGNASSPVPSDLPIPCGA